nr:MAG TPA: hypothetical protein [Caudoviricetes sp.]
MEKVEVLMTEDLARLCKKYRGDPKGAIGAPGVLRDAVSELEHFEGYKIRGIDEDFVCIPESTYLSIKEKVT